eukprot:PLAT6629.1.p1 GENE.PLAT6629.1~~PLAT6629.1.p1  ORF type:complete len:943 (+),score=485.85 PLAT6629.1:110-2830(+)
MEVVWRWDEQLLAHEEKEYLFDHVFSPIVSTSEVYESALRDVVLSVPQGYHGSVFAYGQTSSGKTYTMQGTRKQPGVIPYSINDVFAYIDETPEREFLLRVSYLEIYKECINDLLDPTATNLRVFEDRRQGMVVRGLKEEVVMSVEHIFSLIASGESHRHIGATDFNAVSSRSHTIFRMVVESKERDKDGDGSEGKMSMGTVGGKRPRRRRRKPVRVSILNLIDLAGSESTKRMTVSAERKKEGAYINKSLLTLGKIILHLSRGGKGHIPYRDSKLTRVLQPSLAGNAKIAVVCNVSPASGCADETHSTLKFGTRAKEITRSAVINDRLDDAALLEKYKAEIDLLRRQLEEAKASAVERPLSEPAVDEEAVESMKRSIEEERAALEHAIQNLNKMILNSSQARAAEGSASTEDDTATDEFFSLGSTRKRRMSTLGGAGGSGDGTTTDGGGSGGGGGGGGDGDDADSSSRSSSFSRRMRSTTMDSMEMLRRTVSDDLGHELPHRPRRGSGSTPPPSSTAAAAAAAATATAATDSTAAAGAVPSSALALAAAPTAEQDALLITLREQLSSLLARKVSLSDLQAKHAALLASPPRAARPGSGAAADAGELAAELSETKAAYEELKLKFNVQLADSKFLEEEIAKRDRMMEQMGPVLDGMEKRQEALTSEKEALLGEVTGLRAALDAKTAELARKEGEVAEIAAMISELDGLEEKDRQLAALREQLAASQLAEAEAAEKAEQAQQLATQALQAAEAAEASRASEEARCAELQLELEALRQARAAWVEKESSDAAAAAAGGEGEAAALVADDSPEVLHAPDWEGFLLAPDETLDDWDRLLFQLRGTTLTSYEVQRKKRATYELGDDASMEAAGDDAAGFQLVVQGGETYLELMADSEAMRDGWLSMFPSSF